MDTSNVDVLTAGDIEDQRQNPQWFIDHEYMLRPNQEDDVNKLGFFILKVPEHRRHPPEEFSPQGWRFGLHNRENLNSSGSEALKLAIAVQYGLVGEKWVHFRDAIVDDPKAMLACYGVQDGVAKWSVEQIKHVLALDALYLAHTFDASIMSEHERRLGMIHPMDSKCAIFAKWYMWMDSFYQDLFLIENQISLILIDKVVMYITEFAPFPTFNDNDVPLHDFQQYRRRILESAVINSFMDVSHKAFEIDNSWVSDEKTHILGITYKVICGSKGLLAKRSMEPSAYSHIPSATKLEEAGIKIVGIEGPLCTMSYQKNCLRLPKMGMSEETISFIRNMAFYEANCISKGCLFSNYIFLMLDLLQTPKDVDLLAKHGVIDNASGTFGLWTGLTKGLPGVLSSQVHNDMKAAIVNRCNQRRYGLWSEFKIVFCSKPWLVLSTIAVVLVTLSTLIQTYISVIGSNKMKPKFL